MSNESLPSKAVDLLKSETAPVATTAAKLTENALSPVTKGLGKTLSDVWYLLFGGLGNLADKHRIRHEHALEKLNQELVAELEKIPDEKRAEPNVQIAMNALSDAQYCVEEPELRAMFCKLLASASDSDKASKAHPSFASIIRRMSPFDACLLRRLTSSNLYPICNYAIMELPNGGKITQAKNAIAINGVVLDNMNEVAASLDVLQSLGLIYLDYQKWFTNTSNYVPFENCTYYKELCNEVNTKLNGKYKVEVERGCLSLTGIGKQFVSVCM